MERGLLDGERPVQAEARVAREHGWTRVEGDRKYRYAKPRTRTAKRLIKWPVLPYPKAGSGRSPVRSAKPSATGAATPEQGALAVVLELEDGRVYERAEKLEPCTNIVAEHLAIQLSVEMAIEYGVTDLVILNDSQTPVFPGGR